MPVNSISANNSVYNNGVNKLSNDDLDKDAFLKILTAQLQYQDPMESMDNSEYIAQMAQFAALEQMQNLNENLSYSIGLQNTQLGASLIGKEVKVVKDGITSTGTVDKVSNFGRFLTIECEGEQYYIDEVVEIINKEEVEIQEG